MGLLTDLGPGPVALDTAPLIYFVEEHPLYLPVVEPVFAAIDRGAVTAVTSAITLLETLVVPLRHAHEALARQYEALLTRSRGLVLVPLDLELLRAAARLRAATRMKTPDALQVAAALATGCTGLLTNDRRYPEVPGIRVLQVADYRK